MPISLGQPDTIPPGLKGDRPRGAEPEEKCRACSRRSVWDRTAIVDDKVANMICGPGQLTSKAPASTDERCGEVAAMAGYGARCRPGRSAVCHLRGTKPARERLGKPWGRYEVLPARTDSRSGRQPARRRSMHPDFTLLVETGKGYTTGRSGAEIASGE